VRERHPADGRAAGSESDGQGKALIRAALANERSNPRPALGWFLLEPEAEALLGYLRRLIQNMASMDKHGHLLKRTPTART